MPKPRIIAEHWQQLVTFLRRPGLATGSGVECDRPFMDKMKVDHPGLGRSLAITEFVSGEAVLDRWIDVVILRGIQVIMAARGFEVLMLGRLDGPFLVVHRSLVPLAVRTIPPHHEFLFAPELPEGECHGIEDALNAGESAARTIVAEVAKRMPMPADRFAEHVWNACRGSDPAQRSASSSVDQNRVSEYLALSRGRPRLEQVEMALALSERVLTGKDKPSDRQVQAAAAALMWRDLASINWAHVETHSAARCGWSRVAGLAMQDEPTRQALLKRVRDAMSMICQDAPVDIDVDSGAAIRVYRFHGGQRTLIDRRGGRRGRIH